MRTYDIGAGILCLGLATWMLKERKWASAAIIGVVAAFFISMAIWSD